MALEGHGLVRLALAYSDQRFKLIELSDAAVTHKRTPSQTVGSPRSILIIPL